MRAKKEKSFDGISIRGKETVMAVGYGSYPCLQSIMQIILIEAVLYSVIFGFATGLKLPVVQLPLLGAIFFFGLVCWGLFAFFKAGIVIFLPILATYLYGFFRMWKEVGNGFWQIENYFITFMNKYYGTHAYTFLVDNYEPARVITVFLIFVTLPLALILSLIILNKASHLLYYPVTLPIIILPFVVGRIPSTSSFSAYIAATFGIFVLGNHIRMSGAGTKEERAALKEQKKIMDSSHYRINIKGSFLIFCSVLLLFLLIPFCFSKTTYEYKMNIPKVKKEVRVKIEKIDVKNVADYFGFLNNGKIVIFKYYTASGGLNEGRLGGVGKLNYDNKTDIIINVLENSKTVYLKGFTGSTYDGNAWNGLSDEAMADYAQYKAMWENINLEAADQTGGLIRLMEEALGYVQPMGFYRDYMNIQNVGANSKYTYMPYYPSLNEETGMDTANPEYSKSSAAHMGYLISYYYYTGKEDILNRDFFTELAKYQQKPAVYGGMNEELKNKLMEYKETDKQYRTFIEKYYMQVPYSGLEQLKADMEGKYAEMREKYGEEKALSALTAYIRTYIQKNTAYSLKPGTLPKGKDFVEYFLYEKKQGFCTHYASAAVLAYRFAGVPARYVEGYIAKPTAIKNGKNIGSKTVTVFSENDEMKQQTVVEREVRISDSGAHAWVEVYKDGWGWVPVEMTPGFQTEEDSTPAGQNEITPSVTPTPQATATPTVPEQSDTNNEKDSSGAEKTAKGGHMNYKDIAVFMLTAMLITLVFLITAGVLIKVYRFISLKKAEPGKKTILIYRKVKFLIRAAGVPLDEADYKHSALMVEDNLQQLKEKEFLQFIDIVLKARFGSGPLTPEEAESAGNYYQLVKKTVFRSLPILKRIICGLYFV